MPGRHDLTSQISLQKDIGQWRPRPQSSFKKFYLSIKFSRVSLHKIYFSRTSKRVMGGHHHDLGKQVHRCTFLRKRSLKEKKRPNFWWLAFILFCGLGLVAIKVDEFLYHFVVMMWMMFHHLILQLVMVSWSKEKGHKWTLLHEEC